MASWEGIDDVEGGYTASVIMTANEEKILLQARSLLENINTPMVLEGTLPAAPDEVAIEETMASGLGLGVGDEITLEYDGNLTAEAFRITAVINEPSYCYTMFKDVRGFGMEDTGSNEYYISLPISAFDASYYENCFTTAFVRSDTLAELYYFSDEYQSMETAELNCLEVLAQERAALRYSQLNDEATTELAQAQSDISAAEEKIRDAEDEISDNEATIAQSEEIADGEQALAEARQTLEDARQQISEQLSALGLDADFAVAMTQLEALGAAGEPLRTAIEEYFAGEEEADASETELSKAREELEDGKASLEEAKAEVSDAQTELAEAKTEFSDAQADAAELELHNWIISGRSDVGDVRSISNVVDALARHEPVDVMRIPAGGVCGVLCGDYPHD